MASHPLPLLYIRLMLLMVLFAFFTHATWAEQAAAQLSLESLPPTLETKAPIFSDTLDETVPTPSTLPRGESNEGTVGESDDRATTSDPKLTPSTLPSGESNESNVKELDDRAAPTDPKSTSEAFPIVSPLDSYSPSGIVEAKVGYFFFADSKMSEVYNEGGFDVQVSGSYPVWRWLQVYGSAEFLERNGRSLHGHQKTWIKGFPLSLGLRPVIKITPQVQYYFTLGPRYSFVHVHNNSSYVNKNLNHSGLGFFVNTGFNFLLWHHLLIDVFGEYSYIKMHFHSSKPNVYTRDIQVGGLTFGMGVGYAF